MRRMTIQPKQNTTIFNPFPDKPRFLRLYSTSLLKTLWEKEELLVTCFENTVGKGEIARNLFGELSAIFMKVENVC